MVHFTNLAGHNVIAEVNLNTGSSAKTDKSSSCLADDIQNKESTDKIKVATVTHCLSKHTECTGRYIDCT